MKKTILVAALVAAIVGVSSALLTTTIAKNKNEQTTAEHDYFNKTPKANVQWANLSESGQPVDFTYAAEQSLHAVVHVKTTYGTKNNNNMQRQQQGQGSLWDFFFGNPYEDNDYGYGSPYQQQPAQASGSGVIISPDGYIVTNNHVIEKADEVQITLNDKQNFKAKVIGSDPATDIALIKIEAEKLPYLSFGNSDNVKIGEWVLAIGNPFDLTSTVTAGIVSAKARNLGIISRSNKMGIESFIQTDAAINPGNSGGALVNTRGELIGINSVIASPTGSYAGYGFAVPSQIVQKVVEDLKAYGIVQRAMLGIEMVDLNSESAEKFNIKTKNYSGAIVTGLADDGAAQKAGLKVNDIIVGINDIEITSGSDVQEQIARLRPNDKVKISAIRDGELKHFDAVLRNKVGGVGYVKSNDELYGTIGATLKELSKDELDMLSLPRGIQVTQLKDGKFKEAGIRKGFIITRINQSIVKTIDDVKEALSNADGGVLIEGIYPNGQRAYYAIGID